MKKPVLPVFVFGVLIGGLLGAIAAVMPWAACLHLGCKVTMVNVSGDVLNDLSLVAGDSTHHTLSLGAGMHTSAVLRPDDTKTLVVSYSCKGQRYRARCGGIDRGERRTVTVLDDGKQVIVSYGTAQAVANLCAAKEMQPGDPD